ncbi:MAG: FG-GAP repeat domain-containing protein [Pseudomonadota bacterium]
MNVLKHLLPVTVAVLWASGTSAAVESVSPCTMGTDLTDVAVVDADGDRFPDLAVVCGAGGAKTVGGHLEVWLDREGQGWDRVARLEPGDNPSEVLAGDMDGDGDAELVVVVQGQHERRIAVFENRGDGRFADRPVIHSRGGVQTRGLILHDGDGDGRMDLVVSRGPMGSGATLLRNESAADIGPFSERPLAAEKPEAEGNVAEISGDTQPDLAVMLPSHGKAWLYAGGSDDRLEAIFGKSVRRIDQVIGGGDRDGDQVPELLVRLSQRDGIGPMALARRDGERWHLGEPLTEDGWPLTAAIRDFSGDGRAQVVIVYRGKPGEPPRLHQSDGDPATAGEVALPFSPELALVLDVEGDGRHELLFGLSDRGEHRLEVRSVSSLLPAGGLAPAD